ncbi:MAG: hypothetical protein ACYDGR_09100 [Candidatus Dormibacteria bacterium]
MSASPPGPDNLQQEMDMISLEQALVDFEMANRRVTDLTQRLIAATEENRILRKELELMRFRAFVVHRLRAIGPLRSLEKAFRRRAAR